MKKIILLVFCLVAVVVISGCTGGTYEDFTAAEQSQVEYNVTKVFTLPALGSGSMVEMADGIFVIIGIQIKNNGKEEARITTGQFKLIDEEERKYNVDTTALVYLGTTGFEALPVIKYLGAGLETNNYIVFDVPKDDKGLVLKIDTGMLSDDISVNIGDVVDLNE